MCVVPYAVFPDSEHLNIYPVYGTASHNCLYLSNPAYTYIRVFSRSLDIHAIPMAYTTAAANYHAQEPGCGDCYPDRFRDWKGLGA